MRWPWLQRSDIRAELKLSYFEINDPFFAMFSRFSYLPSVRPNKSKDIKILVYKNAACLLPLHLILRITKF